MPKFNDFELDLTNEKIFNAKDSNEAYSDFTISRNLSCATRCTSSGSIGLVACTSSRESISNCP